MNDKNELETTEQEQTNPMMEVGTMPLLTDQQFKDLELRIDQQQKIRQLVLKVTKPHHWRPMGQAAYLEQNGCKVIAGFLGLGMDVDEPKEQIEKDEAGSYYSFTTKVTISFRGRHVDEFGYADSRDKFLAGNKPQSEVNKGNIKKKSITNGLNRGIKAILGLDFTKAEVEAVVGSLGGQTGVNYKSKPKETLTDDDIKLKDEMKLKIWKMTGKNEDAFKEYLKALTAWPEQDFAGHTDIEKLSPKVIKFKMKTVDKDFADFEASEVSGE